MTENNSLIADIEDNDNVICYCSGTTHQQIKALIDSGQTELERISRITGACSGCGGCEHNLQTLIAEATA